MREVAKAESIISTKKIVFKLQAKNSPFEMAVNFDKNFGDFIVTNFHVHQKVLKYDKCQINFKYL